MSVPSDALTSNDVSELLHRIDDVTGAVQDILAEDPATAVVRRRERVEQRRAAAAAAQRERIRQRYDPAHYRHLERDDVIDAMLREVDDAADTRRVRCASAGACQPAAAWYTRAERVSLAEARRLKSEGARHVEAKDWAAACDCYTSAIRLVESVVLLNDENVSDTDEAYGRKSISNDTDEDNIHGSNNTEDSTTKTTTHANGQTVNSTMDDDDDVNYDTCDTNRTSSSNEKYGTNASNDTAGRSAHATSTSTHNAHANYTAVDSCCPEQELLIALYNNRALAHNKLSNYAPAVSDASYVLHRQPHNVKARLRRALALKHLRRFGDALCEIDDVLRVDRDNAEAHRLAASLRVLQRCEALVGQAECDTRRSGTAGRARHSWHARQIGDAAERLSRLAQGVFCAREAHAQHSDRQDGRDDRNEVDTTPHATPRGRDAAITTGLHTIECDEPADGWGAAVDGAVRLCERVLLWTTDSAAEPDDSHRIRHTDTDAIHTRPSHTNRTPFTTVDKRGDMEQTVGECEDGTTCDALPIHTAALLFALRGGLGCLLALIHRMLAQHMMRGRTTSHNGCLVTGIPDEGAEQHADTAAAAAAAANAAAAADLVGTVTQTDVKGSANASTAPSWPSPTARPGKAELDMTETDLCHGNATFPHTRTTSTAALLLRLLSLLMEELMLDTDGMAIIHSLLTTDEPVAAVVRDGVELLRRWYGCCCHRRRRSSSSTPHADKNSRTQHDDAGDADVVLCPWILHALASVSCVYPHMVQSALDEVAKRPDTEAQHGDISRRDRDASRTPRRTSRDTPNTTHTAASHRHTRNVTGWRALAHLTQTASLPHRAPVVVGLCRLVERLLRCGKPAPHTAAVQSLPSPVFCGGAELTLAHALLKRTLFHAHTTVEEHAGLRAAMQLALAVTQRCATHLDETATSRASDAADRRPDRANNNNNNTSKDVCVDPTGQKGNKPNDRTHWCSHVHTDNMDTNHRHTDKCGGGGGGGNDAGVHTPAEQDDGLSWEGLCAALLSPRWRRALERRLRDGLWAHSVATRGCGDAEHGDNAPHRLPQVAEVTEEVLDGLYSVLYNLLLCAARVDTPHGPSCASSASAAAYRRAWNGCGGSCGASNDAWCSSCWCGLGGDAARQATPSVAWLTWHSVMHSPHTCAVQTRMLGCIAKMTSPPPRHEATGHTNTDTMHPRRGRSRTHNGTAIPTSVDATHPSHPPPPPPSHTAEHDTDSRWLGTMSTVSPVCCKPCEHAETIAARGAEARLRWLWLCADVLRRAIESSPLAQPAPAGWVKGQLEAHCVPPVAMTKTNSLPGRHDASPPPAEYPPPGQAWRCLEPVLVLLAMTDKSVVGDVCSTPPRPAPLVHPQTLSDAPRCTGGCEATNRVTTDPVRYILIHDDDAAATLVGHGFRGRYGCWSEAGRESAAYSPSNVELLLRLLALAHPPDAAMLRSMRWGGSRADRAVAVVAPDESGARMGRGRGRADLAGAEPTRDGCGASHYLYSSHSTNKDTHRLHGAWADTRTLVTGTNKKNGTPNGRPLGDANGIRNHDGDDDSSGDGSRTCQVEMWKEDGQLRQATVTAILVVMGNAALIMSNVLNIAVRAFEKELTTMLTNMDAMTIALDLLREVRASTMLLGHETANKQNDNVWSNRDTGDEHGLSVFRKMKQLCELAQMNVAKTIAALCGVSSRMRDTLRERDGFSTLAAVLKTRTT